MSIYTDIRAGLETHLDDASGLPAIAWENVDYKPTTDTPFIKFQFLPTLRRTTLIGSPVSQRYQGIVRFLLHYPENQGPGAMQAVADSLISRFEVNSDIEYTNSDLETIQITIEYSQQESSYTTEPWYITPVTVGWYIYAS
jgi:hypothetical protein